MPIRSYVNQHKRQRGISIYQKDKRRHLLPAIEKKQTKNNGRSINSRRTVLKQSKTDTLLAKKIQTFFFFSDVEFVGYFLSHSDLDKFQTKISYTLLKHTWRKLTPTKHVSDWHKICKNDGFFYCNQSRYYRFADVKIRKLLSSRYVFQLEFSKQKKLAAYMALFLKTFCAL